MNFLLPNYLCQVCLYKLHISLSGDTEFNPGYKSNFCEKFSVCHLNSNSILAHNLSFSLLNAYLSLHSFDIYPYQRHIQIQPHCLMTQI